MQQEKIQLLLQEIQELAAAGGITNSVREREREGERGRGRGEREVILILFYRRMRLERMWVCQGEGLELRYY